MHDYARALSGECSADGLTYATSTAGDEHNLAMQPSFHVGREMFRYFMFSDKPIRLQKAGYDFVHENLESGLRDSLGMWSSI